MCWSTKIDLHHTTRPSRKLNPIVRQIAGLDCEQMSGRVGYLRALLEGRCGPLEDHDIGVSAEDTVYFLRGGTFSIIFSYFAYIFLQIGPRSVWNLSSRYPDDREH